MDMAMGGAITAVAATTTVGIGATTMAGGIIVIGGDFCLEGLPVVGGLSCAQCRNQELSELRLLSLTNRT